MENHKRVRTVIHRRISLARKRKSCKATKTKSIFLPQWLNVKTCQYAWRTDVLPTNEWLFKEAGNHIHMISIYVYGLQFAKIHGSLRTSPAQAAGVTNHLWSLMDVVWTFKQSLMLCAMNIELRRSWCVQNTLVTLYARRGLSTQASIPFCTLELLKVQL